MTNCNNSHQQEFAVEKFSDQVWTRWTERVERIEEDFQTVALDQFVWNKFRELVVENGDWIDQNRGYLFCSFVRRSYLSHIVIGVRRHLPGGDKGSLRNLLDQIKKSADQITFDFFLDKFPPKSQLGPWQKSVFRKLSKDGERVSADIVQTDIDTLERIGASAKALANASIAHLDLRDHDIKLTFSELDDTVDGIADLIRKYKLFLTGSHRDSLVPTVQYPWERFFNAPLIQPLSK